VGPFEIKTKMELKSLFSCEKFPEREDKDISSKIKTINGLPIELSKLRGDVVLKTILRNMRKLYIDLFKKNTPYIRKRRSERVYYLIECRQNFVNDCILSK
jgi:hypothetical protein